MSDDENLPEVFVQLVDSMATIGRDHYESKLLEQAEQNRTIVKNSIKDLVAVTSRWKNSGVVVSAGPSLHRKKSIQRILKSNYKGAVIAVDGAYISCLKQGLIPDFVVTLDPCERRIVRWFGDPNFEKNSENDDYFDRQDLDVDFRSNTNSQNEFNINLVNKHAKKTKAIVSTVSHPGSVVKRLVDAGFDIYWWNPLVDNPNDPESLTKRLYRINKVPCINTGGNVGTASWVIADTVLKIPNVALVGMDFGYYHTTPINCTQRYYELIHHVGSKSDSDLAQYFVHYTFPETGEKFYTDVTYYWYRRNFLELLEKARGTTINCTEAGTLIDDKIKNMALDKFLSDFS